MPGADTDLAQAEQRLAAAKEAHEAPESDDARAGIAVLREIRIAEALIAAARHAE